MFDMKHLMLRVISSTNLFTERFFNLILNVFSFYFENDFSFTSCHCAQYESFCASLCAEIKSFRAENKPFCADIQSLCAEITPCCVEIKSFRAGSI